MKALDSSTAQLPQDKTFTAKELISHRSRRIDLDERLFNVGTRTGVTMGLYGGLKERKVGTTIIERQGTFDVTRGHTILAPRIMDRGFFIHTQDLVDNIKEVTGASGVRLKSYD